MNGEAVKSLTGMQTYPTYIKPFQENVQKAAEARGEIAGLQQEMETSRSAERAKAVAGEEERFAQRMAGAPQRAQLAAVSEKMEAPFVPTKETAGDMAQLFALINIAGFALGAGGKQNAQAAMSGMNGMMEGYQKGRMDLYKKEKDLFDTNIKQLKMRYDTLDRQLKEAIETYKTDKQAGLQKAEMAYIQAGADFMKKHLEKVGLANNYEVFKQAYDNANKVWTEKSREEDRARTQAFREQQARTSNEIRMAQLGLQQQGLELRRELAAKGKEGKTMTDKQVTTIEGLDSLASGLEKLQKSFKPSFASLGLLGFGADMELEARRRLGDKEGREAVKWWSDYQRLQAPNRHALYGATLTGNELKNYQSFTSKPSDDPEVVKDYLQGQIDYTRSTSDNRKLAFEQAGYKVPDVRARDFSSTYGGGSAISATPSQTRSFNTIQEAESAKLPKGTEITIGGRRAVVE